MANNQLEKNYQHFAFHIEEIDLKLIQGEYVLKDINGIIKPSGEAFMNIAEVNADVPWNGILRRLIVADVTIDKMTLMTSPEIYKKAQADLLAIRSKIRDYEIRLRSFELHDSKITIQPNKTIEDIQLWVSNLEPKNRDSYSNFRISGSLFGPAPALIIGQAKLNDRPIQWDINAIVKNFDLKTLNDFINKDQVTIHS
ncbi:MAG: DUF748 domain-containing protein, partial [Bdellovibrionales bacterium]|nr:DUF748 domain-containing protein [Bdellovibrionales bacterium]